MLTHVFNSICEYFPKVFIFEKIKNFEAKDISAIRLLLKSLNTKQAQFSFSRLKILLPLFLVCVSCAYNHLPENNEHLNLIWYNAPISQSPEELKTGLAWLFSYLGATLPKGDFDKAISISGNRILLKIEYLGFSERAKEAIKILNKTIQETKAYKASDGIDVGRFFALCFNSSWQYYAITGVDKNYAGFKNRFPFSSAKAVALDSSAIATESRLLKYATNITQLSSSFFTSEEGTGHFTSGNFVASGNIEAFDYMANGQPRFVVFDVAGNLQTGASPQFSNAGKPAKCMWCHESKMQPLFRSTPEIPGYTMLSEFDEDQKNFTSFLSTYHETQNSYLQFSKAQDHTQGEIIYLNFFEPNSQRLALEWGMNTGEVQTHLAGISTHNSSEHPKLSDVYFRKEVDFLAPVDVIKVCDNPRENEGFEPDYLK